MRVLLACEESQAVTKEFRRLGHEAYSCDIQDCTGGHPEWHIKGDVREVLQQNWEMIIAFPPCTHLCVSGAQHFEKKRADGRQQAGVDFFMLFADHPCERIAIENPVGIMSSLWREPDQIIQPYYFGDPYQKTTCLWLKGLPPLQHFPEDDFFNKKTWTDDRGEFKEWISKDGKKKRQPMWFAEARGFKSTKIGLKNTGTKEDSGIIRSKTFPGIAKAMAEQWGSLAP